MMLHEQQTIHICAPINILFSYYQGDFIIDFDTVLQERTVIQQNMIKQLAAAKHNYYETKIYAK